MGNTVDAITMDYTTLLTSLEGKLQEYFKTYYDSLNKINNDYGYGALQLANRNRSYVKGSLSPFGGETVESVLYGKSNEYQTFVTELVERVKKDIDDKKDPYLSWLINSNEGYPSITSKQIRELQEKLKSVASERQTAILNIVLNNTTNLVNIQTELNYIFRQLDVIVSKLDGSMGPSNEPLLYDLSGDTFFTVGSTGSLPDIYTSSASYSVTSAIKKFENLVKLNDMVTEFYKPNTSTIQKIDGDCTFQTEGSVGGYFVTCENNRFYTLMSQLYINNEFYTTLVNNLTSGNEIKADPTLVEKIKQRIR